MSRKVYKRNPSGNFPLSVVLTTEGNCFAKERNLGRLESKCKIELLLRKKRSPVIKLLANLPRFCFVSNQLCQRQGKHIC